MSQRALLLLAAGFSAAAGQVSRLTFVNRSVYLDGSGPHFFRAVYYSPTPWISDEDLFYKTQYYWTYWPSLFERDVRLMSLMGANAVRIHGTFSVSNNLGQHGAFLDAAFEHGISVFLNYGMVGNGFDNRVDLNSETALTSSTLALQQYLLAAKHPAVVMVFLGDRINRDDQGYICNVGRDAFGFVTFVPCQFGEDVGAFARALDRMCLEAINLGLACTIPLANYGLPVQVHTANYGPLGLRPSKGVIDWFDLMVPEMQYMNVLSASLVPTQREDGRVTFEIEMDELSASLPNRPFVMADYGVDALDISEWYLKAGSLLDLSYPHVESDTEVIDDQGRFYKLYADGEVPAAEDEVSQAEWLGELTVELETHSVKGPSYGESQLVSGGVVRSWQDEWWMGNFQSQGLWFGGRRGDCVNSKECFAMLQLCPIIKDADQFSRSPCGAAFPGLQPDGYVNEEWFGLFAAEPDCECAQDFSDRTNCAPHRLKLRARSAYFKLQRLWNPAGFLEANLVLQNATASVPQVNCSTPYDSPWDCLAYPAQPRLQNKPGTNLLYLDCKLFLMRGVCYSPTPVGQDPGFSEPWGDYFTDEYYQIFHRDIGMMVDMGANTIRCYSFKTSVRHGLFLDLAYSNELNVVVGFRLGAAYNTPLNSVADIERVKSKVRYQIRSNIHPAIIMWMIGNEANGGWHLYTCDQAYADIVITDQMPDGKCAFEGDATRLLRAIDELCSVATEFGLLCTTALADVTLPKAMSVYPQYHVGAVGWMTLMDGSEDHFTIRHIGLWALNTYPGRDFSFAYFQSYEGLGIRLPVIITEYGADAMDTSAWFASCVNSTETFRESCTKDEYTDFVDEKAQADWSISLAESLESHSTSCQTGCLSKTTSGGSIMAWKDELWRGRVVESIAGDDRSRAMACPEADSRVHSLCGYPAFGQPDDFVNEEWFGMTTTVSECPTSGINRLQPRLVWHGLKRLWNGGSCTIGRAGSSLYSSTEYPLCSQMITTLRQLWIYERTEAPPEVKADRNRSNIDWISALERSVIEPSGDSDCQLMNLLHERKPDLCPAAPAQMINWVDQALNSPDFGRVFPENCNEEVKDWPVSWPLTATLGAAAVLLLSLLCVCTRCSCFFGAYQAVRIPEFIGGRLRRRYYMRKDRMRRDMKRQVSWKPGGEQQRPHLASYSPKSFAVNTNRQFSQAQEAEIYVRDAMKPIASRLCGLFGFQGSQIATHGRVPSNAANAVETVACLVLAEMRRNMRIEGLRVKLRAAVAVVHERSLSNYVIWCRHLGFVQPELDYEGQMHQLLLWYLVWGEASNLRLMPELLNFIFHCAHNALDAKDENATDEDSVHVPAPSGNKSQPNLDDTSQDVIKLPRLVPSVSAAIKDLFDGSTSDLSFLRSVVTPFYEFVSGQMSKNTDISERCMYDDVNEFFWSRTNVNQFLGVRAKKSLALFPALLRKLTDRRHIYHLLSRKTFVERSSWLAVMYAYHRVVLLNILAVHVMLVIAFTRAFCEDDAKLLIPNAHMRNERDSMIDACLTDAHGSHGFKLLSTATLSHAGFQIIVFGLSLWIEPRKPVFSWALLWSVLSFVLPCLLISHYVIERLRTNNYSGLSDSFLWAALVYTGLWTPVLLQIPMKLPGYKHCWAGIAPQWVMRPKLITGLYSTLFYVIVLGCKWMCEYYVLIVGLYVPSRAIWEGDYRCWELGHTGLIGCAWDQASPELFRDIRDWTMRLMLLAIRWSMPIILILYDMVMFHVVTLSLFSGFMGRQQKLGTIRSWPQLVLNFMQTQLLFSQKLMSYPQAMEEKMQTDRVSKSEDAISGFAWAYEGTSREWRDFGTVWNALVESLRNRDLLSNSERDELRFATLDKPEHTVFFSVPQYMVLPAMLGAPVFAASRGKSLVAPSATSYAAFQPTMIQLRDLNTYLLVAMGLVKFDDRKKFRALLSNLMKNAYWIFNLKKQERDKLHVLMASWEHFIRCCSNASNSSDPDAELRLAIAVRSSYQSMLTELTELLGDEKSYFSCRVEPQSLDELFDILRQGSVDFRRRSFSYVKFIPTSPTPEEDENTTNKIATMIQPSARVPAGAKTRVMFGFLELLREGREDLTLQDARNMMGHLREPATKSVLQALSQYTTTDNPGGEPHGDEAKRQLISFCSSLHQTSMPKSPPIAQMKSFSAFTPFFREEVRYSVLALQAAGQDNTTLLTIFKALHPEEWTNFCERVRLLESDVKNEGVERSNEETIGRSLEIWNKSKLKALEPRAKLRRADAGKVPPVKPLLVHANSTSSRISRGHAEQLRNSSSRYTATHVESAVGESLEFYPRSRLSSSRLSASQYSTSLSAKLKSQAPAEGADLDTELQQWASDRAQVLSRTVRGVMLYADALRVQAALEQVPEGEIEGLVNSKFEHVVSCQVYNDLKQGPWEDQFKAQCIDELRLAFPRSLRVAYVEQSQEGSWYSVLLGVNPETCEEEMLYKVQLPGNPIIGEGKPENQNHAIIFTRGEYLQTLDMNQDCYLGEAFKIRNLLECFKGDIRIVGAREHIFTGSDGANAAFAAATEFAFTTILQRFMTYPLGVRFHYGHPDLWDKQWVAANGGVSKASRTLHLSEDIFGGVNVLARGGTVAYSEFFHVGKGRDVTFISTNRFEQKLAAANSLQSISRDMTRFAHYVDLPRLLGFWCSAQGTYISTTLLLFSAYLVSFTLLVLAMTSRESFFHTPAAMNDLRFSDSEVHVGTSGTSEIYSVLFLIQMGLVMSLPNLVEDAVEFGLRRAFSKFVSQLLSLRFVHTMFSDRTRAYHFSRTLRIGSAEYIAAGRSFAGMTPSFTALFKQYARSHLMFSGELAFILIAYAIYTREELYALYTFALWLPAVCCSFSPWIFNPSTFASQALFEHFTDLLEWFDKDDATDNWTRWHESNLSWIHKLPVRNRIGIYFAQVVPVRIVLIISSLAAFEVAELAPVTLSIQRELLSLTLGLGALMMTVVMFVVSYPASARHLFKNLWVRFCVFGALRIAFPIVYIGLAFHLAGNRLTVTSRNVLTILITGSCWLTLISSAIRMMNLGSEQGLSMRRTLVLFANFVQREQDICIATILFLCLQSISFLPVAYIHSTLVVNYAYATSLRIVRKRHKLMHALHSSGWLHTTYRLYSWLGQWLSCCLFPLRWLRPKQVQQAETEFRVFLPTAEMAEQLNDKGPVVVAHKWADMGDVTERLGFVSALAEAGSTRLSAAGLVLPTCASSSQDEGITRADLYDELNAQLKKAYTDMKPRLRGTSSGELDGQDGQIDMVEKKELLPPAPMELCRMPAAALASFDPMSVRDVLRPIGLALAEHFGFQVAQEHDNGKIVHSNLDNQIEHLTFLLKWRMDRTNEEDPQMALWRATDDLHHKALENFRRWVKYVNLQQINARDKNHGDTDIESESWISVSALSGSAWEFFGMWGFTSDINESSWVCNAQLHQLMLWYLIWGEASNLRFAPELLCFLFYCMSNALLLSTESGTEIAILADDADLLKTSGDNGFLNFIITPIYNFLEHEGFRMGNGGACAFVHPLCTPQLLKQANKPIAERVMYDDVNETFWSIESVHSLLPAGCAHVGGAGLTVEPGVPRRAYGHFQRLLRESSRDDDPITSLKVYFKKTYCEVTGWIQTVQVFSRIIVMHAVLLHLLVASVYVGFTWTAFHTWVITHALMQSVRCLVFINVTWSVKRGNNTSVDGKSDSKKRSESLLGFLSKVYHKEIAQVFFFCLFPVFYVVENIVNGRWSENTCPTPDEFCANEVEHGVPFETFPRCIAPTGLDLLLTYCGDCLRDPPGSPFKCELLGSFASECIAACNDLVNYDPIFQVIALIYTIVIVGSTAIFWRPGSLMEMIWDSMSAAKKKTDLGASYVATPELLQVPLRKALLYNLIWVICIVAKLCMNYQLFIEVVGPSNIIIQSDFTCWTPWYGDESNPECATVLGEGSVLPDVRNFILKYTILAARIINPIMIFCFDTSLIFSWSLSLFSVMMGYWMKLGKVSSWVHLIETFGESCSLFNAALMTCADPDIEPFSSRNLELLSIEQMDPKNLPDGDLEPSVEARSAQWQRWARVWNEIVRNLRERDLLSNLERDELLFFMLREPEHAAFFGTPEYIVFPSMMTAPVFYTSLWRHGLSVNYPHSHRSLLQVRDLLAWLLISLGLVEEGKRATLVATLAGLAKQTARLMSSWKSTDVVQLVAVRNHLISLLVLLQRISSDQLTDSPSPTDDTSPDVKDQTPPSAGQAGAVPMSEDDQEYSNEVAIQLVVVLDSVKDLISGCSDEMATVGLHDDDYVVTLYRRFRALISLAPLESPQGWQQACTTLRSRACAQVLQALHLSLTSANPGAEPTNDEARRQLLFFCNSLRNATMPHAVPVRHMPSYSVLTPHFNEEVSYSQENLTHVIDDGTSLLNLLQALFSNEWKNLCQRIRLRGDSGDPVPYQALKTWCSDRGQLLSRTVRGVMLYADALRIQARLEQVPEEEIEALVASKFEYVVSSQNFYKLATSDIPESQQKAHFIDELRKQFPHSLRIAYVDEKDGVYSSVLLRDDSETRENIVIKVRLPGNPIIGEGKPENQNHAIIFTRGEYMQTLDMNQDGYLAEALKLRNMLGCFKGNIRIVGCREHIFSKDGGTIAAFAASTELVFGTTFQRFMTDPLCVRFHYGHPDVWDKQWVVGNGGVSKASRTLHLSEDIFGGINCIVRGGAVDFVEFVQVGKGRDMSFIGVNGFEQKISAGNALQCTTRDFYRLGTGFDLPRLLSLYFTSAGHFLSNKLTIVTLRLSITCWLIIALLRAEEFRLLRVSTPQGSTVIPSWGDMPLRRALEEEEAVITDPDDPNFRWPVSALNYTYNVQIDYLIRDTREQWAIHSENLEQSDLGKFSLSSYEGIWLLLQLSLLSVLPLVFTLWLEKGLLFAVRETVKQTLCGSWLFYLFLVQTRAYHFGEALVHGRGSYVATGRGYSLEPGKFVDLYKQYAQSHFYHGIETFSLILLFYLFTASTFGGWSVALYIISLLFSSMLFNPQALSVSNIKRSFSELQLWLLSTDDGDTWASWHTKRLRLARNSTLPQKIGYILPGLWPRFLLLLCICSRLNTDENSEPSYRTILVLFNCGLFFAGQIVFYLVITVPLPFLRVLLMRLVGQFGLMVASGVLMPASALGVYYLGLWHFVAQYVNIDGSTGGLQNGFLLFFASTMVSSILIQILAILKVEEESNASLPRHVLSCLKLAIVRYADFWYFYFDSFLTFGLLLTLRCLAVLPVVTLQSQLLFNRSYAMVISRRLRRSKFLARILA